MKKRKRFASLLRLSKCYSRRNIISHKKLFLVVFKKIFFVCFLGACLESSRLSNAPLSLCCLQNINVRKPGDVHSYISGSLPRSSLCAQKDEKTPLFLRLARRLSVKPLRDDASISLSLFKIRNRNKARL